MTSEIVEESLGDVVLEVLDITVADDGALEKIGTALGRLSAGDRLTVKVLRDGKVVELASRVPASDRR